MSESSFLFLPVHPQKLKYAECNFPVVMFIMLYKKVVNSMKLKDVPLGETVRVVSMDLGEDTERRMQALGMLPGTPIKVLHRKKSGTMVVLLRSNRFALGSKMSAGIEVDHV